MELNFYLILSLSLLFIYIIFLTITNYRLKKSNVKITSDEFLTVIKTIDLIIHTYKLIILNKNIEILKSKYDLNPESQTNSIKSFNVELKKLKEESLKYVLLECLSDKLKNTINKYFTIQSLSNYIILILEEE